MTGLNFILLTHNVRLLSLLQVCTVVTMVVIRLGERNAQADNGRAEMVCNDKWRKNKIKQKLQKPKEIATGRNNTNAKRNVKKNKQNIKKANYKIRKMDTVK